MSIYLKTANLDSTILTYKIISDIRLGPVAVVDVRKGYYYL